MAVYLIKCLDLDGEPVLWSYGYLKDEELAQQTIDALNSDLGLEFTFIAVFAANVTAA